MTSTSPQEQTREILERLKLRLGPTYEDLEDIAYGLSPQKAAAYWAEQLRDAQMAEQISKFTAEERKSWNDHLAQLRGQARDALRAIGKFSVIVWEQVTEAEEFELNPESYWRRLIAEAEFMATQPRPSLASRATVPLPTPAEAVE
jgi:hypothetical protein